MRLFDVQCSKCREVTKDVDLLDEQMIVWLFCETCQKETEMLKIPGGHVSKTSAAAWRKGR